MSPNVCENCGHPKSVHDEEGQCQFCVADKDLDETKELCPGFKPDIFNMWEENEVY